MENLGVQIIQKFLHMNRKVFLSRFSMNSHGEDYKNHFYNSFLASKEIFKTWLPTTKDDLWNHLISVTEEFKNFAHCQK
jgi:hypothetical protein